MNQPGRKVAIAVAVLVAIGLLGASWIVYGPSPLDFAGGKRVDLDAYSAANPSGVPQQLATADLVTRGEYLARAADCEACHTVRGSNRFSGGLAFKLPFGTLYSPNITPDKETGIGAWSDADFLKAIHQGIGSDGKRLYPAFPYTAYTYLTKDDVLAIKAYLFSLPPVHAVAPDNTLAFPFNQRRLMAVWAWFFNPDRRFQARADRPAEWNRGAYLVEALGHCGECHTPRNLMQALDNRRKFSGAITAGWNAYNVTADRATGIGAWSDVELAQYLSNGHSRGRGTASGPMGEAVNLSLRHLSAGDIDAIVAYLHTVPAISRPELPATLAGPAPAAHNMGVSPDLDPKGKQIFEGACESCHGWTGSGTLTAYATLTGARAINDPSAINVTQIVLSGAPRESADGMTFMPAFGAAYSDTEIAAVANYVTARFGAKPSQITAQQVAELRRSQ